MQKGNTKKKERKELMGFFRGKDGKRAALVVAINNEGQ